MQAIQTEIRLKSLNSYSLYSTDKGLINYKILDRHNCLEEDNKARKGIRKNDDKKLKKTRGKINCRGCGGIYLACWNSRKRV